MFWLKLIISATVIALVSELGKKSTLFASVLASLPLTSILAITWLYFDTHDRTKTADLTLGILWAIIPSLIFFVSLPLLLKTNLSFYLALLASCAVTFCGYSAYLLLLKKT